MRRFTTIRSTPIPLFAAVVVLLIGAGAVFATGSTTPAKVCVPGGTLKLEGKPVLSPKGGACKTGYTLSEVGVPGPEGKQGIQGETGKEGVEGKAGSNGPSVVARARSVGPASISGPEISVPLTGASWTQHVGESNEVFGQVALHKPSYAHCGGRNNHLEGRSNLFLYFKVAGIVVWEQQYYIEEQATTEALDVTVDPNVTPLFDAESSSARQIEVAARVNCSGAPEAVEYPAIESVKLDVVGIK